MYPDESEIIMRKTWIVTGSSVGLGREIVEAALAAGHNVVGTARDPRTLADFEIRYEGRFSAEKLDVTDPEQSRLVVASVIRRFGGVDVLVNNAGFSGLGAVENIPIELVEQQFTTNFMGALHSARAVLPWMRQNGGGRIIMVSSIGARISTPGAAIYYASKAAVSALAETLALEVAPFGIMVTAVEPGGMKTRFADAASMKVSPFDGAYNSTVGETVAMMRSVDYQSYLHDPSGHAAMIIKLAECEDAPTRLLAGGDAYDMASGAASVRHDVDKKWESLSRSATTN